MGCDWASKCPSTIEYLIYNQVSSCRFAITALQLNQFQVSPCPPAEQALAAGYQHKIHNQEAIVDWPPEPVLLVLDAFKPSLRQQLLQQASRHSPGAWVLQQHHDQHNDQDLAELKRLHAPKMSNYKKEYGATS
jgi:hypothetical protein